MRFSRDRRAAAGDQLARVMLGAPDALTFDELLQRIRDADVGDVARWLGHALERGYIEEIAPDDGHGRRFRVGRIGHRILTQGRRGDDALTEA
jgi:hypothetical protein